MQSPSAVILEPPKLKSVTVSIASPSICYEVMGPDAMIVVFWMLSFITACASSSPAFLMMYSAYKLNKQGGNKQPWRTPVPIWKQSFVSCPVLTVASWQASSLRHHNEHFGFYFEWGRKLLRRVLQRALIKRDFFFLIRKRYWINFKMKDFIKRICTKGLSIFCICLRV